MDGMDCTSAREASRKNHLWVLFAIAFPAAVEVWASWVGVGSRSGFPVIRLPFGLPAFSTGFSLAVGMEAYWGYALYVWLAAGAGPRSRKFAMQSAIGAFALSLLGQIAYHLMLAEHVAATPVIVVVFVAALPVTLLALVAFLIHLMHADRQDAEDAEERTAEESARTAAAAATADERTALRAELDALRARANWSARADLATAQVGLETAQNEAAQAAQENEILARKLDAAGRARKRANQSRSGRATARETQMTKDVDARTKALSVLAAEPGISGAALGPRVGMSKRWGQLHKDELAAMTADLEE